MTTNQLFVCCQGREKELDSSHLVDLLASYQVLQSCASGMAGTLFALKSRDGKRVHMLRVGVSIFSSQRQKKSVNFMRDYQNAAFLAEAHAL